MYGHEYKTLKKDTFFYIYFSFIHVPTLRTWDRKDKKTGDQNIITKNFAKGEIFMKIKPIGIVPETATPFSAMSPSDFSDKNYTGVQLRADANESPVIIMKSRKPAPLNWKVVYGFTQVYFETFKDAVSFCESRNLRLMK